MKLDLEPIPPGGRVFVVAMTALLLALLFPWAPHTFAQSSDQRLSPPRFIADIDPDMEVQAAARNGDRVLVVWGSSRRGADSALEGALWWQFVEAGEAVGSPQVVPDATPSRSLSVTAVGNQFIILWNDLRDDAPALFFCLLDMDGALSEQTSLWNGEVSDAGVTAMAVAGGYRIFWSGKGEDVLRAGTIDRNGLLIGEAEDLGQGAAGRFIEPVALPGYRIIERHGALPLLIDNAGNEHPLGAAAAKFAFPYAIGNNGSIVTIAVDTVRLYRSILDLTPTQSAVVSYHPDWIMGSSVVQFDSLGRIVVLYATGGGAAVGRAERVYISIYAVHAAGSDTLVSASRYLHDRYTIAAPTLACEYFTLRADTSTIVQGIGGHYLLRVSVSGSRVSTCLGEPVVDAVERVEEILLGTGNHSLTALPTALPAPVALPVERLKRHHGSVVMVMIDRDSIILAASSAGREEIRIEQFPGITLIDGRLVIGWLGTGLDTAAMLAEWNSRQQSATLMESADLGHLPIDSNFRIKGWGLSRITAFDGSFVLRTTHVWDGQTSTGGNGYRQYHSFLLPTINGWRKVGEIDAGRASLTRFSFTYNSENEETQIAWGYLGAYSLCYRLGITAYDKQGNLTWSIDSLNSKPLAGYWIVPTGFSEFVVIDQGYFTRFRDNRIVDSIHYPEQRFGTFRNLLSPYVISYNAVDSYMDLVLYNQRGERFAATSNMPRRTMPKEIFVLQDPVDFTIILIWAGNGVTMARYDLNLKQIGDDKIISDTRDSVLNPAAIFHNDSLFVVWEDHRVGTSAIYGRAIKLREPSGIDDIASIETGAAITFSPNPTSQQGIMSFPFPAGGDATVEVFDALGRVQLKIPVPPGARSLTIPTNRLAPGFFLARLIDGERTGAITFMVTR